MGMLAGGKIRLGTWATHHLTGLGILKKSHNISQAYAANREKQATGSPVGIVAGFGLQRFVQRKSGLGDLEASANAAVGACVDVAARRFNRAIR